jgi:uracil-DNA glycosylase family 4
MSSPSDGSIEVRHLVLQRLESLRRAGVTQLARRSVVANAIASSGPLPTDGAAGLTRTPVATPTGNVESERPAVSPSKLVRPAGAAAPLVNAEIKPVGDGTGARGLEGKEGRGGAHDSESRPTLAGSGAELEKSGGPAAGRGGTRDSERRATLAGSGAELEKSGGPAAGRGGTRDSERRATMGKTRLPQLEMLRQEVAACTRCPNLAETRMQTVFGAGDPFARLVFMGEAPGAEEDRTGEPFVGRAGQLLTDIIEKGMLLQRTDVYILNTLKCRPPGNRLPHEDEVTQCRPFFERQLELIRPEFICCLGLVAAQALLQTKQTVGQLRGSWHEYQGSQVIVTYHPSYLLRNPAAKQETWKDIKMLLAAMGLRTQR